MCKPIRSKANSSFLFSSIGSLKRDASRPSKLHMMLHLALTQRLVESLAERQVGLVLGAGQELFHLPGARTGFAGLLLLLRVGGGWCVLLRSGRNRCRLLRVGSAEHSRERVANRVSLEKKAYRKKKKQDSYRPMLCACLG